MTGSHEREKYVMIAAAAFMLASLLILPVIFDHSYPEGKKLEVGVILPLSGDLGHYGRDFRNGIDMAVEAVNEGGGIDGAEISVIYIDNEGDLNRTISAFENLSRRVPVVIGTVSSSNTLAIAPLAEEKGVVLVSPAATNPKLSDYKNYVFRTISSDRYQGRGIAKLMLILHPEVRRVAVLYIENEYGKGLKEVITECYGKSGGEIVLVEGFSEGESDFSEIILRMKERDVEAVFLIDHITEAARLINQAADVGLYPVWFGSDGLVNDELIRLTGVNSEGLVATIQSNQILSDDFLEKYREKFGSDDSVNWPVSYGYDTLIVISQAIDVGGYDAEKIRDAMGDIRHIGVNGPKVFDKNGDIPPAYDVLKVHNGKWERIKRSEIIGGGSH